ncbi:ABC transporter substrate-binding protein [Neobacillus rhizophilus]|uniref:ABC transporter substrate-binding protein n=1 Tax=Neobacillus rhizophilus TaxID=2833579 RepID=A0A942YXJ7_9BACI|nr:ABC transporter substrate-binding protein [Neobacillus rhizophilus]MBS4215175.1 ABC transporter substrate-binding protein [Neobacillus rhizophilus]
MKNVLKRVGILILSILLLSACNSSKDVSKTSEATKNKNAQGVTDDEIVLGAWAPLSGAAAQWGTLVKGAQSYFNKVNAEGGINGRKIRYVAYDDEYQPSRSVAAAKKLVEEDKVFAIVGALGTSHHKAALPYLTKKGIPVVAFASGDSSFVNPPIKTYFGLQTNYDIESRIFSQYAAKELKAKTVGILFQNDDFGKSYLAGAQKELKKLGIDIAAEVAYNLNDVDFSTPAMQMKKANPDVILVFGAVKPVAGFWKELDKIGGKKPAIFNYGSGSDMTIFELAGNDVMEGVMSSTWMTSVSEKDNPKIQAYLKQFTKDYPDEDPSANGPMSGWTFAQVMVEGLKRCGDDLSWENFIKQMETLKDWNGSLAYNVTYSPKNRYGQTSITMIQAKNGKLVKISDVIKYEP